MRRLVCRVFGHRWRLYSRHAWPAGDDGRRFVADFSVCRRCGKSNNWIGVQ